MLARFRSTICLVVLCLCGCPIGTQRDHYRPHGHQDTTIAISPSGDAILFNATGTGGRDLYLLRLADLKVLRIADTPDYEVAPSFSPDGQRIVCAAGVPGDRADHIFTIGRDGGSQTRLTDIDANDTSPQFSPDGSMIVFARDKTYNWGRRDTSDRRSIGPIRSRTQLALRVAADEQSLHQANQPGRSGCG